MKTRLNFAAALLAGGLALGAGQACAMPAFDHALTTTPQAAQPEQGALGLRPLAVLLATQLLLQTLRVLRA